MNLVGPYLIIAFLPGVSCIPLAGNSNHWAEYKGSRVLRGTYLASLLDDHLVTLVAQFLDGGILHAQGQYGLERPCEAKEEKRMVNLRLCFVGFSIYLKDALTRTLSRHIGQHLITGYSSTWHNRCDLDTGLARG